MTRRYLLAALAALALPLAATAGVLEVRSLPLESRDLVYEPISGLLYASVPSTAGVMGNSIAAIDPATGTIRDRVWAGSEPGILGVSDDGQFLYVGMDGAFSMRRLRLPALSFDLDIPLGGSPYQAPYSVRKIRVQPGNPHVVAAAVGSLDSNAGDSGVVVYLDATRRNRSFSGGTNFIAFSSHDPTLLYAYNSYSSGFEIRRIRIDNRGAVQISANGSLVQSYNVAMEHEASLLYFTNGAKVDPEANLLVGTYALPFTFATSVLADSAENRVHFLFHDRIETYDLASREKLDSLPLPGFAQQGVRLVRWGPGRLAFRTGQGRIVFVDRNAPDGDGDGIGDGVDLCPGLADPAQADTDADGIGDACDLRVDLPDTASGQCALDLDATQDAIAECVSVDPYDDEDRDGEHDASDRCPGTSPLGAAVDEAGCAAWQFCRKQTLAACKKADWKNDEAKSGNPRDCAPYGDRRQGASCESAP